MKGRVYLVGAGCGEADLITVRGLELLRRCDTVIYDDLIDQALLDAAPVEAEQIYMGKRLGRHSAPQGEISRVLVEKASEGKTVVRLKGGDPFVFGRGGEEMEALAVAGIPCEEVPGITSAVAIPAAAGIPVTHRGLSRSFHVITGHTCDTADGTAERWETLAALEGTLVFLMGLSQLEKIAAGLLAAGKDPATSAAVVSGGNAAHPLTVRGTLADIAERARQAGAQAPAVIVVGRTAALDFSSTLSRPLAGVRVGLTGTAGLRERLGALLRQQGAQVSAAGSLTVEELSLPVTLTELCAGKSPWLVFTSANGVGIFFRKARREGLDLRRLAMCRFAVIGDATRRHLSRYGIQADLCPEVYTSAGLGAVLRERIEPGEQAVLLRSRQATDTLPELLAQAGIPFRELPLYDLRPETTQRREDLETPHYLVFASAGGVEAYFASGGTVAEQTVCVCIGPVTARVLEQHCEKPFLTAEGISVEGVVRTILAHRAAGSAAVDHNFQ